VLLLRLRQVQEEAEDGGDASALLEFGVNQVAGARQRDLIAWYFDLLADRCAPLCFADGRWPALSEARLAATMGLPLGPSSSLANV
jgi:hypothetical protein